MDSAEKYGKITVEEIKGLNERRTFANPDQGELDILKGAIPNIQGTLTKFNGIKLLLELGDQKILNICQTNDSRGNILVQTDQFLYQYSSDEFFGQPIYVPNFNYTALPEEENMAQAILVHFATSGTNGGSSTTSYAARPLNTIVSQLNPDGTAASFVSAVSTTFTLAIGKYRINGWAKGSAAATTTSMRAQVYNTNISTPAWSGAANQDSDEGFCQAVGQNTKLYFGGSVSVSTPTAFEIRQKSSVATTNTGFGAPINDGSAEVYCYIEILKTA